MWFVTFWLQVFDVCDVSDHDGGDELRDSPQRVPENPKHSHNDRQSPKSKAADFSNPFLNLISTERKVIIDLVATGLYSDPVSTSRSS